MTTNIGVTTDANSRMGECESSRPCNGMEMRRRWWKRRCLRRICCFFGLLLLINICLTSFAISKLKHIEIQLDSSSMEGPGPDGPNNGMHYGPDDMDNGPNNYGPEGGMDNGPNGPNGPNGHNGPNTDIYYGDNTINPSQPNVDPSQSNEFNGQNKHHFDRKKICSDLCTEICTATTCDVFACSETCVSVFSKRHEMRMKYGQTNENVQPLPQTDVSPSYPVEQPVNGNQIGGSSQPIEPENNAIPDIGIMNNNNNNDDIDYNNINNNNNNNNNNDNTRPKRYHHRNKKVDSQSQENNNDMNFNVNRKRMPPHQKQERSDRFGRFNF